MNVLWRSFRKTMGKCKRRALENAAIKLLLILKQVLKSKLNSVKQQITFRFCVVEYLRFSRENIVLNCSVKYREYVTYRL